MADPTTKPALTIDPDLALRLQIELGYLRQSYVETQVSRRLDRVEGDMTRAQVDAAEARAYRVWGERHPALNELWFDVLQNRALDGGGAQ